MKKSFEHIRRIYFEILLKIGGLKYRFKNATAKFIKSQEVSYNFNEDVAKNYRYYEPVGIGISNYGNGPHELHLMDREQLMTSLGHCYATLKHVHGKYIDTCMKLSDMKLDEMIERANDDDDQQVYEF